MIPESWDIESREAALETARLLLDAHAVTFDPDDPFRLETGLSSPIRVDGRAVLAFPAARSRVVDLAVRMVEQEIGTKVVEVVAAGEGAAVPFATLIADRLRLPLAYVRKRSPEDPHKHRIEGAPVKDRRVLIVEQLAVDGRRKARFAEPLRAAGGDVRDALVMFQYGIFDAIHEHLSPLGISLHALATWWDLLEVARREGRLAPAALDEIERFLHDPAHWHRPAPGKSG